MIVRFIIVMVLVLIIYEVCFIVRRTQTRECDV